MRLLLKNLRSLLAAILALALLAPLAPPINAATLGSPGQIADTRTIFLTSGTSWTVPSDWNSSNNTIEVIGGGAGGASSDWGGGGGAYSQISNLSLAPGASVTYQVGAGGAAGASGGDTYFNGTGSTCSAQSVCAKGGAVHTGGAAASGIGTIKYSGGNGGDSITDAGGGGGGAGGPHGDGANGANGSGTTGGAGGGAGGGSNASGTTGGNNYLSTGGGTAGNPGTAGGGGGGNTSGKDGGDGGAGIDWDATHGAGGGAGAGGHDYTGTFPTGGLYGGGGAAKGDDGSGASGVGAQGIIVITYSSLEAGSKIVPVPGGLVGYWTFGGALTDWVRGQTSDTSGHANTGLLVNMSTSTSPVAGAVGQGLNFVDAKNTAINLGTSDSLNITGDLTIAAWIKPTAYNAASRMRIFDRNNNSVGYMFGVDNAASSNALAFGVNANATTNTDFVLSNPNVITLGVWQFVAITYQSSDHSVRFYVNGNPAGVATVNADPLDSSAVQAYIGATASHTTRNFNGSIDEVRVYNKTFSSSDIQRLYGVNKAAITVSKIANIGHSNTTAVSNGLVGYWTFDGSSIDWRANTVADSSGQGNTVQLVNMSTTSSPAAGVTGQALQFNGTNAYVRKAVFSNPPTSQMTLCAWVKTAAPTDQVILNINRSGSNITNEAVFEVKNTGSIRFWDYTGAVYGFVADSGDSSATVNDGKWHLACFVKNATSGAYYIDGAPSGTKTAANNVSYGSADWVIGGDYRDNNSYFNGSIDGVWVYNRALSASEINALYKTR